MANLSELRNFFRKDDVKEGDIITFFDAGAIEDVDFSQGHDGTKVETVLQINVTLPDGTKKLYTPNNTTLDGLMDVYGKNTEDWIGKRAKVTFVKQIVFGKQQKVLILEAVEEEIADIAGEVFGEEEEVDLGK